MTYGSTEDGGGTFSLTPEEHAALKAGDRVSKRTASRSGIYAVEIVQRSICPTEQTKKYLRQLISDYEGRVGERCDFTVDAAMASLLSHQQDVHEDLRRYANELGGGDVPVRELVGLSPVTPSARILPRRRSSRAAFRADDSYDNGNPQPPHPHAGEMGS